MFFQQFPVLMQAGVLGPVTTDLVIKGVKCTEAATANEVMMFDFTLTAATSFSPSKGNTSAFGLARKPILNTYTNGKLHQAVCPMAVAETAISAGASGDLRVIGVCSPTLVSTTNVVAGSCLYGTLDTTGKLKLCPAPSGALSTTANVRNIHGISLATSGTTVFFNGLGLGSFVTDIGTA